MRFLFGEDVENMKGVISIQARWCTSLKLIQYE